MFYLRYLCLLANSGVQHILCCVFVLCFLRLVYPMLLVSADCPFLIAPSVFSNVYLAEQEIQTFGRQLTSFHICVAQKYVMWLYRIVQQLTVTDCFTTASN